MHWQEQGNRTVKFKERQNENGDADQIKKSMAEIWGCCRSGSDRVLRHRASANTNTNANARAAEQ